MKSKYQEPKLDGYTKGEVIEAFKHFRAFRSRKEKTWKLIRKIYSGDFWNQVKDKLPEHQILPDTNYLEYVEKSIVNSIYTGDYIANVLPRHYEDNDAALALNSFLTYQWDKFGMKSIFPKLGKNAILYNYAGVQVGWNADLIGGSSHSKEQGSVELKFLPPEQIYLDPSVGNYMEGRALFVSRKVSIFDLMSEPNLKDGAKAYRDQLKEQGGNRYVPKPGENEAMGDIHAEAEPISEHSRSVHLIEAFWKVDNADGVRVDHLFIVDEDFVIHHKEDIYPNKFPVVILYGEEPDSDPYNIPMAKKIIPNIVALNILDSIEATHVYLTQNRTKLINVRSGINYRSFAKYGHMPHLAFQVNGDPNKVVRYVDVQEMPRIDMLKMRLEQSIFLVTGVDMRYTGRDTGSVQTTGGMDLQQQRVVSMSDNLRINALEVFVERLTSLVVDYYVEFGSKYNVPRLKKGSNTAINEDNGIDFENIPENAFDYTMAASPYLPKNLMRLSDAADQLMELQGQYQYEPPLITHEEWLMWKDFPQKDLILQRMRQAQQQIEEEELIADLMSFAGLIDKGMTPEEAIQTIIEEKQFKKDNPHMANPGSTVANGQGPII
jgi:hypothetical protein